MIYEYNEANLDEIRNALNEKDNHKLFRHRNKSIVDKYLCKRKQKYTKLE